jgi:hypothetical protein
MTYYLFMLWTVHIKCATLIVVIGTEKRYGLVEGGDLEIKGK